jgi:hypothetical protein
MKRKLVMTSKVCALGLSIEVKANSDGEEIDSIFTNMRSVRTLKKNLYPTMSPSW